LRSRKPRWQRLDEPGSEEVLLTRSEYLPGDDTWLASDSPSSRYSAVFEDNGETGYFYAYERTQPEGTILDALHIYNVVNVVDREIPSGAEIKWSPDGLKASLLLNNYPHAVIDFAARRAYCRNNFPPTTGPWSDRPRVPWSEDLMSLFNGTVT
jgi:hypothetical protein